MPKVPGGAAPKQRHNPLGEEYSPSNPLKQKAGKKRKLSREERKDGDKYVDSKASQQILRTAQELLQEDEAEVKAAQPNPAFTAESRTINNIAIVEDDADEDVFPDEDEDAWASDEEVEEAEVDPNDRDTFDRFFASQAQADPSLDPNTLTFDPPTDTATPNPQPTTGGTNLVDLILEKIAQHEAQNPSTLDDDIPLDHPLEPSPQQLSPKIIQVYTQVGQLLSRLTHGPLPKPFKILPSLPPVQIPPLIDLTQPDRWTPYAHFMATRLFVSAKPAIAQGYLTEIVLPKFRDEIAERRQLHPELFRALKKALYRPAAFFKGLLFPLLEDECTLREAYVLSAVLARVSVPALHSAAAVLRICDIAAERFSVTTAERGGVNAKDTAAGAGGTAATNMLIKCLLEKRYALPYKVVDALVFHFLRFKAMANLTGSEPDPDAMDEDVRPGMNSNARIKNDNPLPVLWHQTLLAFAQRYRNDITEDQREALLDLVRAVGHHQIGPEVRRELLEGRSRPEDAQGSTAANVAAAAMGSGSVAAVEGLGSMAAKAAGSTGGTEIRRLGNLQVEIIGGDDTMVMG